MRAASKQVAGMPRIGISSTETRMAPTSDLLMEAA